NPVEGMDSGELSGTDDEAEEDIRAVYSEPPLKSLPKGKGSGLSGSPARDAGPSGGDDGEIGDDRPCIP
ncbi:hypothetical protein A2U01_0115039, partial [Trifolium medium]|nr:hypothetical protein [Trifolium medium]